MTGFFHHDLFLKHLENYTHVERPDRLKAILDRIHKSPVCNKLQFIDAEPAEPSWIERIHDPEYVQGILSLKIDNAVVLDWGDTVATPGTPQAALHAAGAGVQAVRKIMAGELTTAFCAVRPPGHHAEQHRAMGFCIFNNIAIAAAHLVADAGLDRVAIIDWDIHHGNGTERTFIDNDHVLYISLHQFPHYPGTGDAAMTGKGDGVGYNLNIPMGAGAGDSDYREAFESRVLPAIDDYGPKFILISAGFDAHVDDPLSATEVTSPFFGEMTRMIKEAAATHCHGRVASFLEGGYDLNALAESVEAHLTALVD